MSTRSKDLLNSTGSSANESFNSSVTSQGEACKSRGVFGCGCGSCSFSSFIEKRCPHPVSSQSGLLYLDTSGLKKGERDILIGRLLEESDDMMFAFQRLVSKTCDSLELLGVTPEKLVKSLMVLGALDPVYHNSNVPLFHERIEELLQAPSVFQVMIKIRDYMSFFNYHVLEHIIIELGTESNKAELEKYEHKFKEYCKRRVFECPPKYGIQSTH